ncbi:uncharacterized protein RSE6_03825 [Rhynchosporium secalis]|uniref:Uncharacterized protein n=1 Tax=Rhynchosporium secalis TaxID=38038 RepID=A0A1E1M579_RHYSE|nr:uncharacterized protein RSE6_03825 [Rhynchosporium secalis]
MKLTSTVILFILAPMSALGFSYRAVFYAAKTSTTTQANRAAETAMANTRWAYTPQVDAVHKGEHKYVLYVPVSVYRYWTGNPMSDTVDSERSPKRSMNQKYWFEKHGRNAMLRTDKAEETHSVEFVDLDSRSAMFYV